MMKRQKEVVSDQIPYSATVVLCHWDFTSLSHCKSDVVEQILVLSLGKLGKFEIKVLQ